jgi:hypothetical protein
MKKLLIALGIIVASTINSQSQTVDDWGLITEVQTLVDTENGYTYTYAWVYIKSEDAGSPIIRYVLPLAQNSTEYAGANYLLSSALQALAGRHRVYLQAIGTWGLGAHSDFYLTPLLCPKLRRIVLYR